MSQIVTSLTSPGALTIRVGRGAGDARTKQMLLGGGSARKLSVRIILAATSSSRSEVNIVKLLQ